MIQQMSREIETCVYLNKIRRLMDMARSTCRWIGEHKRPTLGTSTLYRYLEAAAFSGGIE